MICGKMLNKKKAIISYRIFQERRSWVFNIFCQHFFKHRKLHLFLMWQTRNVFFCFQERHFFLWSLLLLFCFCCVLLSLWLLFAQLTKTFFLFSFGKKKKKNQCQKKSSRIQNHLVVKDAVYRMYPRCSAKRKVGFQPTGGGGVGDNKSVCKLCKQQPKRQPKSTKTKQQQQQPRKKKQKKKQGGIAVV